MTPFVKPPILNSGQRQRLWRIVSWVAVAVFVAIAAAIVFPVFASARVAAAHAQNRMNLKKLAVAMIRFSEKHGDKFPPASSWYEAISSYLPPAKELADPQQYSTDFGYAMNADLSEKTLDSIQNPGGTILIYETKRTGHNLSSPITKIPEDVFSNGSTGVVFCNGAAQNLSSDRLAKATHDPDTFTSFGY